MFANVEFSRTKGEEIKLTDDDIDNGVDGVMPDGDDDGSEKAEAAGVDLPRWAMVMTEKCLD